jgi:glycosyltransferase involved in cell wall biosynthesis
VAAGGAGAHPFGAGIVIDPTRPDYRNTPVAAGRSTYPYEHRGEVPPLISIITPFFNTGALFHETAHSVLAQSLSSWEWVIINDGSTTPESLAILDVYRQRDPRIRVLDVAQNHGPSAARNVGCINARASSLLFLDSDDLLEPTAAEKWWWFLASYPEFGFVKGFSVGFGAMTYLASGGFHEEDAFLERNRVDVTSLVRADVFHAAGGFPEATRDGLEDWEFWLRCGRAGFWGGTVPEYLSWYRRRDDDALRWRDWQGDGGSAALRARMREEFRDLYADRQRFPKPRPSQIVVPGLSRSGGYGATDAQQARRDGLARQPPHTIERLLVIVPWMTVGGADRFNLDLAAQLTARGWSVSVAALAQGDQSWMPAFTAVTPDVFVLPDFVRLSDYPRFLVHLIESRQINLVMVTNAELGYRLLPYLRARCDDVTFVDFCHMEQEEWLDGGYPRLSIDAAACLDRSIVLSDHLRKWMIARGRVPERIAVSHNGVQVPDEGDIERQRTMFRARWSAGDTPVIVYAGRMVEQKRPQIFADALCRLWAAGVDCLAVVAGDGPLLREVRQRLEQANARRTVVLGSLPPETLDGVLCAADILCLPSRWEGIALVVQEAMARGVAVVTADVGGQSELVTSDCGVLIPPTDGDALVTAYVEQLRRLIADPEARRRLGVRARQRVRDQFTIDQMGARMDTLLRGIDRHAPDTASVVAPAVEPRSAQTGRLQPDPAGEAAVVESMRAQYVPYWQWVQTVAAGRAEAAPAWNRRMFRSMTMLEPVYRWGLRRGWRWLPALRRRLRGHVIRLLRLDA